MNKLGFLDPGVNIVKPASRLDFRVSRMAGVASRAKKRPKGPSPCEAEPRAHVRPQAVQRQAMETEATPQRCRGHRAASPAKYVSRFH